MHVHVYGLASSTILKIAVFHHIKHIGLANLSMYLLFLFIPDLLHIFSYLPRDLNFLEHTSNIGWKE